MRIEYAGAGKGGSLHFLTDSGIEKANDEIK
jgi:hypothetical protein